MDNFLIRSVINTHQRHNIFKGVFPCDSLPKKFSFPAIFIINLSPNTEPGSHWVAICITSKRYAFYFYSFGFPVNNHYISHFLKKHAFKITHNVKHITLNKCGQICL